MSCYRDQRSDTLWCCCSWSNRELRQGNEKKESLLLWKGKMDREFCRSVPFSKMRSYQLKEGQSTHPTHEFLWVVYSPQAPLLSLMHICHTESSTALLSGEVGWELHEKTQNSPASPVSVGKTYWPLHASSIGKFQFAPLIQAQPLVKHMYENIFSGLERWLSS